jgi:hypothetical protein
MRNLISPARVLFIGACLICCRPETEFEIPRPDCTAFGAQKISLENLKDIYQGNTMRIRDQLQWEGYIVSTDKTSNIFGEIYIQEKPADPGGGIVVYTDLLESHSLFPVGSRVAINLEGLYFGKSGGSYELGGAFPLFGTVTVGRLPASLVRKHLKVLCSEPVSPGATKVEIDSLSEQMLNTLVHIQQVEFVAAEVGRPFAESGQQTRRSLMDCRGNTLDVRNSGYSDFHSDSIPGGHGSAVGVLTSYRNQFELVIRSPEDLRLFDVRCEERFVKKSSDRILISEIADPDNIPEARFIELFNASDSLFALHGWEIRRFTNANTEVGSSVSLDDVQILAGGTFVLSAYPDVFEATYGFPPDLIVPRNGPADSNGDDSMELVDPFGNVVDSFGIPGTDGSGTAHEFEDGKALRRDTIVLASPEFRPSEWIIFNDSGGYGTLKQPQEAPQDFTPGVHPN